MIAMKRLIALGLLLAGCASESPAVQAPTTAAEVVLTQPTAPATEQMAQPTQPQSTDLPATSEPAPPASAALPAWQTLPLTDARTGATFTFADYAGQTVFVEPMATWCTNCRAQLGNVASAREQLAGQGVVFVALSVETNITATDLAAYADRNGFGWTFAVLTPDMLGALTNAFGFTINNPPSTPHFLIRPDGTATSLITGIESSAQIIEQINAARG
ncbi:MAG: TlpA family protein disulfide reductase [Pleurocapsa minor GSE-CHR-MK-17-07R]|jgi:thiol-disulfide isomerase/thioredoxin|nr:TlpA family protein disulfide reductase [Pleurocapsa minor GSE-CHR-MK 17-07R]